MSKEQIEKEAMEKVIADAFMADYNIGCDPCPGTVATALYEQNYRKQSEWISVEERLPEPNENCLVSARVGDQVVIDLGEIVQYCDGRIFGWMITNDWNEGEGCKITHWMPLPEPPKGAGNDA